MRCRGLSPCAVVLCLCVLATANGARAAQERPAGTSSGSVRALLEAGRYDAAEAAARLLVAETPPESAPGADLDLLVEALLMNGRGAAAETRALAERAVRVKQARLAPNDPALAVSLRNLARALSAAGEPKGALPLLEQVLAIQRQHSGPDALEPAEALTELGRAQIQTEAYDEAKRSLDQALSIRERRLGPDDAVLAGTLEQLAVYRQRKADYPAARVLLDRALAIRERTAPGHPASIETLNLLGLQFWFEGKPEAELEAYRRALAIGTATLRPDHPLMGRIYALMSTPASLLGDYDEARTLQERALRIAEANYGPSHVVVANCLNDLANTRLWQSDYSGARALYERAMRIVEGRLGPENIALATYLFNLSLIDAHLGDVVEARRHLNRAVRIWTRVNGATHPNVALANTALGEVLLGNGRNAEAQVLFERALAISERSLKPDHYVIASTLAILATSLERQRLFARAREMSARAVTMWERSNGPDSPKFAEILERHANVLCGQGECLSARGYYERALEIRRRFVGPSNPRFAEAQAGLALALAATGDAPAAIAAALQAEATGRQHLRTTLRYLPERQSLTYAATRPRGLDLAISLLTAQAGSPGDVFDALVKGRALVLDEMATRHRSRTDDKAAEAAPLRSALTSARQRLANLVVRGPGDQRPELYLQRVETARRDKEAAERALADSSATFWQEQTGREDVGAGQVRAALPPRTALVAFTRYTRTIFGVRTASTGRAAASRTVPSYAAFVLRTDTPDISVVPLGAAASIDTLIARWQQEATGVLRAKSPADADAAYRAAGTPLRQRIWDPVASHLADLSMVFVVPDGSLNLLSFEALPVGRAAYLVERGPAIHYLSAERDLIAAEPAPKPTLGLLAVGGAAFDDATPFAGGPRKPVPALPAPGGRARAQLRGGCADLASMTFEPLTATTREVRDVAKRWIGPGVQLLEGRGASERAFKQAAAGRQVIHLATHGFFLGSGCAPGTGATRGVGGLSSAARRRPNAGTAENPLLLSGLALAGANRRALAGPVDEDGILTAEEVASLDLAGVDWAVLSACDTGLGEVAAGEGVLGLRRAFQVAGVHTVIMSLWGVEDQAALAWMQALYDGRIRQKLTTAMAVHRANLSILQRRRAAAQSTHPFYWAGFVAAGDWR